jgi:excisionase family DNA binding protein
VGEGSGSDPLQLLTAAQVAQLLQVKVSWVLAEARAGRLRKVPVGKHIRFRRQEIARYQDAASDY